MAVAQLVLYAQEVAEMAALCERLCTHTDAQAVLLVDKNGQFITSHGDVTKFDTTSLASLTAGNMASTQGLARLIGEDECPVVYHEGKNESLLLSVVATKAILVVIFDQRTTLGLVRLRAKKTREALAHLFDTIASKAKQSPQGAPFAEMTDDDIDNLFGR